MAGKLDSIQLYGGEHAIEEVRFVIVLAAPLDRADMARFTESQPEVSKLFPSINHASNVEMPVSSMGPIPSQQVEFVHPFDLCLFGGDGKPIWTGQFGGNTVAVSCRAYTRWTEVWPEAERRLTSLARLVDSYKPVRAIDYWVTDTFHADAEGQVLLASQLFQKTPYVPGQLNAYKDPRWDFSQAWFEQVEKFGTVLKRISGRGAVQGRQVVVSIDNTFSHRPTQPLIKLGTLLDKKRTSRASKLAQTFNLFHDMNKELLQQLLNKQLLTRMGLIP